MRILGLDYETNGVKDSPGYKPTEVALVIWDTELDRAVRAQSVLIDSLEDGEKVPEEILELTGISRKALDRYGLRREEGACIVRDFLQNCQAVLVWNGLEFDKPLLEKDFLKFGMDLPKRTWIDLKHDGGFTYKLEHSCADSGFLNPFPHNALGDVLAMFRICQLKGINLEGLAKIAESPFIEAVALVDYDERHLAKKEGFQWDPQRRIWVKNVRESQAEDLRTRCAFDVSLPSQGPF